ncbi:bile acid:sodium symporter family protein [Deinococcus sp. Marseille-Q6407]|uniref:bile acid:sodium symporter family protein n=1 Tax=Deinococcus sp. Marseille-Q6407 TaxID=2969223 RepID=UPI0021C1C8C4|nr:bile acid:sodium symporter family protein [Deinococcus sp. Marseille-Q6407]
MTGTAAIPPGRAERLAVTVFPVLVVLSGLAGYLLPGTFKSLGSLVPWGLGLIMFFMGATLTLPDFARIASRPLIVAAGVAAQYVIMPLLAWGVARLLQLPPELATGLILLGCVPGGTASNVVTYLARGDVALSVSLTTASTLLAPIMTPLLTLWLMGQATQVSFSALMISILKTVLLPVVLGVIVRVFFPRGIEAVQPLLPWLSTLAISFIVAVIVGGAAERLATAGLLVLVAVVLHNGLGLLLGYLVGRSMGLSAAAQRTLAFEVGMQNSGLAASLATLHFSPLAALPGAVAAVWHNLSGAMLAAVFARQPLPEEQPVSPATTEPLG